jgi:hypothetical protein
MPEIGTSGSMSGDGKRAIGKASSTAPILDSTCAGRMAMTAELGQIQTHAPQQKYLYSITLSARSIEKLGMIAVIAELTEPLGGSSIHLVH